MFSYFPQPGDIKLIVRILSSALCGNASGRLLGALNQRKLTNPIAGSVGGSLDYPIPGVFGVFDLAGAEGKSATFDFLAQSLAKLQMAMSCLPSLAL